MKTYSNVVIVTGGSGFIGSAFLRMLVPKYPSWFFINLDVLTYAGNLANNDTIKDYENYLFVKGNICDRNLVERLFDDYKVNIVINFAAESHVDKSIKNAELFVESNINGVFVLLDVSRNKWGFDGTKLEYENFRFIQVSTDEVYGSLKKEELPCLEEATIAPNSPYSASKAAAELLVRSYFITYGLPVLITRSSNNYGPYQNTEKFTPTIINSLINGINIPVYGDGTNIRDWIYVDDNIDGIELIMLKGKLGEIYNIGGDNELSNLELVKILINYFGSESKINFVADRLGHDFRYSIDSSKLKKLGWNSNTSFHDGLKKTFNFYLKNEIK